MTPIWLSQGIYIEKHNIYQVFSSLECEYLKIFHFIKQFNINYDLWITVQVFGLVIEWRNLFRLKILNFK